MVTKLGVKQFFLHWVLVGCESPSSEIQKALRLPSSGSLASKTSDELGFSLKCLVQR